MPGLQAIVGGNLSLVTACAEGVVTLWPEAELRQVHTGFLGLVLLLLLLVLLLRCSLAACTLGTTSFLLLSRECALSWGTLRCLHCCGHCPACHRECQLTPAACAAGCGECRLHAAQHQRGRHRAHAPAESGLVQHPRRLQAHGTSRMLSCLLTLTQSGTCMDRWSCMQHLDQPGTVIKAMSPSAAADRPRWLCSTPYSQRPGVTRACYAAHTLNLRHSCRTLTSQERVSTL